MTVHSSTLIASHPCLWLQRRSLESQSHNRNPVSPVGIRQTEGEKYSYASSVPHEDEWLDVASMKALPQETLPFLAHRVGTALVPRLSPQSTACELTHQACLGPCTLLIILLT